MLVYAEFKDWENKVLDKAATELGVLDRCVQLSSVHDFAPDGTHPDVSHDKPICPSVLFLNMAPDEDRWRASLAHLRDHAVLGGIPTVGLGSVASHEVSEAYDLGISSYIRKPETFDEILHTAKVCLNYWLNHTQLPAIFLREKFAIFR